MNLLLARILIFEIILFALIDDSISNSAYLPESSSLIFSSSIYSNREYNGYILCDNYSSLLFEEFKLEKYISNDIEIISLDQYH